MPETDTYSVLLETFRRSKVWIALIVISILFELAFVTIYPTKPTSGWGASPLVTYVPMITSGLGALGLLITSIWVSAKSRKPKSK